MTTDNINSPQKVYDLALTVAKIDGKVDLILVGLNTIKVDHESRIRKLETRQTYLSGALAVLAAIYAFITYNISGILKLLGKN
jgi:hypothetical protein